MCGIVTAAHLPMPPFNNYERDRDGMDGCFGAVANYLALPGEGRALIVSRASTIVAVGYHDIRTNCWLIQVGSATLDFLAGNPTFGTLQMVLMA